MEARPDDRQYLRYRRERPKSDIHVVTGLGYAARWINRREMEK